MFCSDALIKNSVFVSHVLLAHLYILCTVPVCQFLFWSIFGNILHTMTRGRSPGKLNVFHFYSSEYGPQNLCLGFNLKMNRMKKKSFFFNHYVMFILVRGLYNMWGEPESHYSLKSEAKQTLARHHALSTSSLFSFPLSLSLCSTVFTHFLWLCN